MRARHTYRSERRNLLRACGALRRWRSLQLRIWQSGQKAGEGYRGVVMQRTWVTLVRALGAWAQRAPAKRAA